MQPNMCPCGSLLHFTQCCMPLITSQVAATSPLQLMRSRYSAFVHQDAGYLINTLHPSKRTPSLKQTLEREFEHCSWHSLFIMNNSETKTRGEVEFVAFYSDQHHTSLKPKQLHERSSFTLEQGHWYYVDGHMLSDIKIQRNQVCWCGSGKKFKQCCG